LFGLYNPSGFGNERCAQTGNRQERFARGGDGMNVNLDILEFGQDYERLFLAKLWGYENSQPIKRGVITPKGTKYIILFVTKDKEKSATQYNDYIDGNFLFWEGEEKHGSDKRIVEANKNNDEIHLFYRNTHHTPFVYFGKISLTDYQLTENAPSEFVFQIDALSVSTENDVFKEVQEHAAEYKTLDKTEQEQIVVSRLGQGNFRRNVIRLWGSCSVTGLQNISLLRASHIKPWKDSNNQERLNPFNGLMLIPDYDFLFDKGLITFNDVGRMIVSKRLEPFECKVFDVNENLKLRNVFPENKEYLEFHRSEVFK
jgi:putative restriction endonuclease